MQVEKKIIVDDLLERVNGSPFALITDFSGLKVSEFEELRTRLEKAGSAIYVTKNSYIKRVIKEANLPEGLTECLTGQTAIVVGEEDVCSAAKILKNFKKEFTRPTVKMGVLDGKLMSEAEVDQLADLPSREALLSQLLGLIQRPATDLVRLLNEPGTQIARVLQANIDKG
ncbi:MAG: large subunit ribosomal protein L10 [Verrucomicrobiales bacterium]|jgi:large subunit ribosomal protein L10